MGCVCDSVAGKTNIPPSHCGKVECMFHCNCTKDALKLTNHDHTNKIGIAAEGLRSYRHRLAQEELKFSNTVVASGQDYLMIGTKTILFALKITKLENFTTYVLEI